MSEALLAVALIELNAEIMAAWDEWQGRTDDKKEAAREKVKIIRLSGVEEVAYNDAEMVLWLLSEAKAKENIKLSAQHKRDEAKINKSQQEFMYLRVNLNIIFCARKNAFGCKLIGPR